MAMQFGDKKYISTDLNSHVLHQPHAAFTYLVGNILEQAYSTAHGYGRVLIAQPYGYNLRGYESDLSTTRAFREAVALWVGVARGWAHVPDETSHIVALFVYALENMKTAEVDLRLIVDDGSAADMNTVTYSDVISSAAAGRSWIGTANSGRVNMYTRDPNTWGMFPYTNGNPVYTHKVDVALSDVSTATPGICEIRLEVRGKTYDHSASTYTFLTAVQPLYALIYSEMRF